MMYFFFYYHCCSQEWGWDLVKIFCYPEKKKKKKKKPNKKVYFVERLTDNACAAALVFSTWVFFKGM